jgi:tetratricopeptide (TPR) repeat protein
MKPMKNRTIVLSVSLFLGLCAAGVARAEAASTFQRSVEEESAGRLAEALSALERLPPQQAGDYVVKVRRGWLLYRLGRQAEAIDAYTRAIAAAPGAVEPRIGILLPLLAERRWVSVQKIAREALRLEPGNYLATLRLAYATYQLGQHEEALGLYRRLTELYPSDTEARAGLGWCLVKLGKAGEATSEFQQILHIAPAHALAREGLKATGASK